MDGNDFGNDSERQEGEKKREGEKGKATIREQERGVRMNDSRGGERGVIEVRRAD